MGQSAEIQIGLSGRNYGWILCCSVLQCVAVCCSVLQCVVVCCTVLQLAVRGSVLQCVAVCCSVLNNEDKTLEVKLRLDSRCMYIVCMCVCVCVCVCVGVCILYDCLFAH